MIQSKKLFNLMAMLTVAAMFVVVGCDDNGDDPDPQDALVGSWKLTSLVEYYGSSVANPDSSDDWTAFVGSVVFTFNADGTGKTVFDEDGTPMTDNWTYSATATEITVTEDDATEVAPYDISGNTLTLTYHDAADTDLNLPESWTVLKFTKQ